MATTRVHLLATELGVKSKAIIDKCQAEGLDMVKNHMSTISAGLAATIREWFSEGEHTTAVEASDRVDLTKVRVKTTRRKKEQEPDVAEEVAQPESEAVEQEGPGLEEEFRPVEPESELPPQEAAEQEPPQETAEPETPVEEPESVEPAQPEPVQEQPQAMPEKPAQVMPAGPMLSKPTPAQLSGPRVVRVEAPEPQRTPRQRPPMGGGYSRPPMGGQRPPMGGQRPPMGQARPPMGAPRPGAPGRFNAPAAAPVVPTQDEAKKKSKDKHGRKLTDEELKKPKLLKMRERDIAERRARLDAAGGENIRLRPVRKIENKQHDAAAKLKHEKITVYEPLTVRDLALAMGVKTTDIITKLMKQGTMATANNAVANDVAELIALDMGYELDIKKRQSLEEQIARQFSERAKEKLARRSPIVTVLGHVDHGKTSLLDRIRKANVAGGEAGGITQHIGSYQVVWGDKKVTFLDTPGHEAFTAMRARGANMTDVVVLVVAADDGVMPQTIEAIHHAKAAGVPIIIALNKTDLPGIDYHRIYGQLSEHELIPTEWGGKTEIVKTSAVTGAGVQELLEYLDYTAELLDLKADNSLPATGWVVEAKMTPDRGPVATILIKEGTLNKGDVMFAGTGAGRIRTLKDSLGHSIKTAVSAMPVEISGLDDVPQAGDRFYVLDDINKAKSAAEENKLLSREEALAQRSLVTMDNLFSQIAAGKVKELNLIIRADVQGSVNVLEKYLTDLSVTEVKIKVLHAGVGGITEGDVILAEASSAIVIGFNVVADDKTKQLAESKGVDIRFYNIIYRITEDLKKAMSGMLDPEQQEKVLGRATVRSTFKITGVGTIAGCYVTTGVVNKNAKVRLTRNNVVVKDEIKVDSLKHFKDDVKEVKAGFECGIKLAGYDDLKNDDVLEVYEIISVARTL